jgi:hypothetical protein
MRIITARYDAYSDFRIPKNVPLLDVGDYDNDGDKAWSWWIKWDTLCYIDDKGVEHEIKPYFSASKDENFKRPSSVHEDDPTTGDTDDECCESFTRDCIECKEDFTPSKEHAYDKVCDECVSEHGKTQVLMPKCAEEGCENHAAKNEFYPNGDPPNTEYWTLCDECFKKDQDEEDSDDE